MDIGGLARAAARSRVGIGRFGRALFKAPWRAGHTAVENPRGRCKLRCDSEKSPAMTRDRR